jgi:hypothetical protein
MNFVPIDSPSTAHRLPIAHLLRAHRLVHLPIELPIKLPIGCVHLPIARLNRAVRMQSPTEDPPPFPLGHNVKKLLGLPGTRFWSMVPSSSTPGKENCVVFRVQGVSGAGEDELIDLIADGQFDQDGKPVSLSMRRAQLESGVVVPVCLLVRCRCSNSLPPCSDGIGHRIPRRGGW